MTDRTIRITQEFVFHAAHFLPWHAGKCAGMHGHTYRLEVSIEGALSGNGIIVDFDEVSDWISQNVLSELDHHLLNDVLPNPTAELIADHIFESLSSAPFEVQQVRLWETPESSAIVTRS